MSIPEAVFPDVSYAFGPFRLDPAAGRLLRAGEVVPLTPKLFDTLLLFVENAGRVLSREMITERIWPDTIVSDTSLTQNIFLLRRALGEEYIETVPRRGYRFNATVTRVGPPPVLSLVEEPQPQPEKPRRQWPRVAIIAAVLIVAIGSIVLYRAQLRARSAFAREVMALRKQPSIVTMPFANERRKAGDMWLRNALPRMIADQLAAGERLRVAPSETAVRLPLELHLAETTTFATDTARRIGRYASADLILCGSFVDLGGPGDEDFELTARVQDVRSGEVIAVATVVGNRTRLFGLVQRAAADLRTQLGITAPEPEEQRRAAQASAPANLTAARLYTRGIEELHQYDLLTARDLLLQAEKADPKYALTQKALCETWTKLGFNANAKEAAARALALSTNLPRTQQLEIEALHAMTHKQLDKAIETREALWRFYPDNTELALDLMTTLFTAQKGARAIEVGREVRTRGLALEDPRVDFAVANAHFLLGDWKSTMQTADAAIARLRDGGSRTLLARSLSLKGSAMQRSDPKSQWRKPVEESLTIARSIGFTSGMIRALNTLAIGYADDDQPEKAVPLLREAMRIATANGDIKGQVGSGGNLVYVANQAGDWEESKRAGERALPAMRASGDKVNEAVLMGLLGQRAMAVGDFAEGKTYAEECLRRGRELSRKSTITIGHAHLARIAWIGGRFDEARAHLKESISILEQTSDAPNLGMARNQLARVAFEQGRFAEARALLEKSTHHNKWLLAARLELEERKPQKAIEALAKTKPGADVTALRALAHLQQNKHAEAQRLAAQALQKMERTLGYHEATEARIDAAIAEGSVARLDVIARDAMEKGDVLAALEARLGRCQLTGGGCAELATDARARGFVRIARKAASRPSLTISHDLRVRTVRARHADL